MYDGDSRVTAESKGGSTVVSYGYDPTGKKGLLCTITDSNSRTLSRGYDGLNRLTSVAETAGTAYYSYDAASNETGITLQNGVTVTKGYDHAGRLTSIVNATSGGTPTILTSYSYVLDSDGQVGKR